MKQKVIRVLMLAILVTYFYLMNRLELDLLIEWTQDYIIIFVLILMLLKIVSNVLPMIPAGIFTLAAIPLIGWFPAYLINMIGGLIGSVIAYAIGKRYGIQAIQVLFGEAAVKKLDMLVLKKDKEFEALLILRLLTSQVSQIVSFGSGFMRISFIKYMLATFLAGVIGILMFYLGGTMSQNGSMVNVVAILMALTLVMYFFRRRYFKVFSDKEAIE